MYRIRRASRRIGTILVLTWALGLTAIGDPDPIPDLEDWPSGRVSRLLRPAEGRYLDVHEPDG